jgi:hypothetical protein
MSKDLEHYRKIHSDFMGDEGSLINSLERKDVRYNFLDSLKQLEETYKESCEDAKYFKLMICLVKA